jgi:23S rRNA pseudouridine1911/1915/1917 synthase
MKIERTLIIPDSLAGTRLDQALAKLLPDFSRTQIQSWIKNSEITLAGQPVRPRQSVAGGEEITLNATLKPQPQWEAEQGDLNIIYEDEALLIVNKPASLVVHPGAGHLSNTLLNVLLHHAPELRELPRAGILHRLDKDTSGLLVVAKTRQSLAKLNKQLKARSMSRVYQAIVTGTLASGGVIEQPIGRHPVKRKRMAVIENGRPAVTHYRVMEKYRAHVRLKIQLETGRTHQIRVHMAYIHHPLLGDPVYNGRLQLPKGATPELIQQLRQFKRQALHASELGFIHPITQKPVSWQAPLPEDMQILIEVLRRDREILC